jgi:hypothetical protein
MSITAPEPSEPYFVIPSHQSASVCVSFLSVLGSGLVTCIPPFVARQGPVKDVPETTKIWRRNFLCGPCYISLGK